MLRYRAGSGRSVTPATVFPAARNVSTVPYTLPNASPSGRSWASTRMRWLASSRRSTSSIPSSTDVGDRFAPFCASFVGWFVRLGVIQTQFVEKMEDVIGPFGATVHPKGQHGRILEIGISRDSVLQVGTVALEQFL